MFKLASFNKTINLATTGAGGMDTGTAPTSGYVALYAIFNPTTAASALLATSAASAAPSVYGGANMPSGYTASALISVWPTNASKQFVAAYQVDRHISIGTTLIISTTTVQASATSVSIASVVPANARVVDLYAAASTSTAGTLNTTIFGAAVGGQAITAGATSPNTNGTATGKAYLSVPQTVWYTLTNSAGTPTLNAYIVGYEF
jgi:hypothetical protein